MEGGGGGDLFFQLIQMGFSENEASWASDAGFNTLEGAVDAYLSLFFFFFFFFLNCSNLFNLPAWKIFIDFFKIWFFWKLL